MRRSIHPARQRLADRAKAAGGALSARMAHIMGPRQPSVLGILMLHRVTPHIDGLPPPGLNVTPDRLRSQLCGLQKLGYQFVDLEDAIDVLTAGESLPLKAVALTADDGFAGIHRFALPILGELGIPAAVFPVTSLIGTPEPMHFDSWGGRFADQAPQSAWRSLDWKECKELQASGLIRIGCHTHSHTFQGSTGAAFERDCVVAADRLEEALGRRPKLFAFPFGDPALGYVTPDMLRIVEESGFSCALTTRIARVRSSESPFGWPRIEVIDADTAETLSAKLEGWYDWMRGAKALVHKVLPW